MPLQNFLIDLKTNQNRRSIRSGNIQSGLPVGYAMFTFELACEGSVQRHNSREIYSDKNACSVQDMQWKRYPEEA